MYYLEAILAVSLSVVGRFGTFLGSKLGGGEKIGAVRRSPKLGITYEFPEIVLPVAWLTFFVDKEIGAETEGIK